MARKHRKTAERFFRVGVDTGGTFTDFVYAAGSEIHVFKVASTPDDPARAITEGLRRITEEHLARARPLTLRDPHPALSQRERD